MPINDFISVLQWWGVLFVIGLVFLPATSSLFQSFFDRGYIFAKILGILCISYVVFLLGIIHILPFTNITIFIVTLGFVCAMFFVFKKGIPDVRKFLGIYVFEELLFFAGVYFWSYVRGFAPDIHGLEKYMDFGFVNSILRSTYFPPKDMWYTPYPINYYYFGHLTTAMLTKFSGIPANITFNLMLATLFSFTFVCTFSLGGNLIASLKKIKRGEERTNEVRSSLAHEVTTSVEQRLRKLEGNERQDPDDKGFRSDLSALFGGLLTAFLTTFAGNLHTVYTLFKPYDFANEHPAPFWQLPFMPLAFPNQYWYPNATRFIYHTIHEFPIYSFVVSDLHGHVLDIPFVLLTIATLLSLFKKSAILNTKYLILNTIFIGFLLAAMYMTNAWDGLIYFLLTGLVFFFIMKQKPFHVWLKLLSALLITGISFFIFSKPFSMFFDTSAIVHGIGILCAPPALTNLGHIGPLLFEPNHCQKSSWWQLLILYGFFYFWALSFVLFLWKKGIRSIKQLYLADGFVLILITLSTILIIIPEFAYLKDIYPEHYRANTMFKLVYQSFIMLSICSGYIIMRITSSVKYLVESIKGKIFAICYLLFFLLLS